MDRGLNSALLPFPAACAESMLNKTCAAIMSDACASSNQEGYSKFLDGNSNCSIWKSFYEVVHDSNPDEVAQLVAYLDASIDKYCSGAFGGNGFNSTECQCLNMPILAADQCAAQSCVQNNDCNGQNFQRYSNGFVRCNDTTCTTYSGQFIDISFPQCIPQVCWNQQCWNPNSLLKISQRDQQKNCTPGICMSIIVPSTISNQVAPADSFAPASFLQDCGAGYVDPYPIFVPTVWRTPVDNVVNIPMAISNGGNLGPLALIYQKTLSYEDIGAIVPDQLIVGANGRLIFNVSFDPNILLQAWKNATNKDQTQNVIIKDIPECTTQCSVPSYTIVSPIFFYTYLSEGVQKIFSFTLDLELSPPIGQQQRENPIVLNKQIPSFLYIPLGLSVFFFLIAWIFYFVATRRASEIRVLQ